MGTRQLDVAFFIQKELSAFKQEQFRRLGAKCNRIVVADFDLLAALPNDIIPMVGCTAGLGPLVRHWQQTKRPFIYWDRGYFSRQGSTALPRPRSGNGYYRVHFNSYQMTTMRPVPNDRFKACKLSVSPWRERGHQIVVATPSVTYADFHDIHGWTDKTVAKLKEHTDRPIWIRHKTSTRPLQQDLMRAHALVTHGSIAAVEAVVMGVPVFVDESSAAALVGKTDLADIEDPITPDRMEWLNSLAYSQFLENEIADGRAYEHVG